jgi:hypothetical protein
MRQVLVIGVLLAASSLPVLAVNFSGKWEIQRRTAPGESGNSTVLTLNQIGDEVTGNTNTAMEMWDNSPVTNTVWSGKVEGNTLSFYVWSGSDQPVKMHYCGTMAASGEEVVFTVAPVRSGESGGCGSQAAVATPGTGPRSPRQVTAQRVK